MKLRHEGPYLAVDPVTAQQLLDLGRQVFYSKKSDRVGDIEPLPDPKKCPTPPVFSGARETDIWFNCKKCGIVKGMYEYVTHKIDGDKFDYRIHLSY